MLIRCKAVWEGLLCYQGVILKEPRDLNRFKKANISIKAIRKVHFVSLLY